MTKSSNFIPMRTSSPASKMLLLLVYIFSKKCFKFGSCGFPDVEIGCKQNFTILLVMLILQVHLKLYSHLWSGHNILQAIRFMMDWWI